jgi:hypothetical protein
MYVGSTSDSNCQSVPSGSCVNADSFVYTQQIQFGNGSLSNSNTVSLGNPTGATLNSNGVVQNPLTDTHARLGSTPQAAMASLWQTTSNGQTPLVDGQVVYIVETYFQSLDLNVSSLSGGGVYARYFY